MHYKLIILKKNFFLLGQNLNSGFFFKNSKTLCSKFIYNGGLGNVLVTSFDQSFSLWYYFKSTSIESRWKGCAFMCVLEKCKNVNIRQLKDRKRKMPLLGMELHTFSFEVQCLLLNNYFTWSCWSLMKYEIIYLSESLF